MKNNQPNTCFPVWCAMSNLSVCLIAMKIQFVLQKYSIFWFECLNISSADNLLIIKCKKGDQRVCSNNRVLLSASIVRFIWCWRSESDRWSNRIQEEQYRFYPGCGTVGQLFTLSGILDGSREFANHMFFGLGEGVQPCSSRYTVRGAHVDTVDVTLGCQAASKRSI